MTATNFSYNIYQNKKGSSARKATHNALLKHLIANIYN